MSNPANPRLYTPEDRMIPRVMIGGVIALLAACLAIAIFARATDRPLEAAPPVSPVKTEAALILDSDPMSGAVRVSGIDGREIISLSPEDGGFIAGVHRVILRERALRRQPADGPVLVKAFENGRMAIHDPASGWSADLMGFGEGNADAFARLLALIEKGKT